MDPRGSGAAWLPGDVGFTLIELLVVITIIGILATIAIPLFLNQRTAAYDATAKADLHQLAQEEEAYLLACGSYTNVLDAAGVGCAGGITSFRASPSVVTAVAALYDAQLVATTRPGMTSGEIGGFCLRAVTAAGHLWIYNSTSGGLMPADVTAC